MRRSRSASISIGTLGPCKGGGVSTLQNIWNKKDITIVVAGPEDSSFRPNEITNNSGKYLVDCSKYKLSGFTLLIQGT